MPGLNGIYVGNTLRERYPNILIFIVTSFMEYLDDAMRFHVFRYLSKPIDRQRLFRNLDDALAQYHASSKKIAFETKDRFHTLDSANKQCYNIGKNKGREPKEVRK